jgi:hypothetical protein
MNTNFSSHTMRFQLAISADEYLAYYQGSIKNIQVRTADNRTIRFPASAVQEFLTHGGIFGTFEIQFDGENKLIGIRLITP